MAELEKIEKVSKVDRKRRAEGLGEPDMVERVQPNKEQFDAAINAQRTTVHNKEANDHELKKTALMEEIREVGGNVDMLKKKTPEEIVAQTRDVIAQVDEIKKKLQTPDLRIEPSYQSLMENKLVHIDEKLKVAVEKAGGDYTSLEVREARASFRNPIEKFLGYLESGENQLHNIAMEVGKLGEQNRQITPAAMLLIQVKVGFVQQELEFFTSLLNKSLESTKTLLNVQV